MYRFFKFILGTGLVVISFWSCSLDDAAPVLQNNAADPIPMAKEFYTQEKPKQENSSFRIQAEQEIFPFWAGAKIHADGRILIVPAYRKLQVRYEAGYLRRFVFELDERGQVIRGGMLELAGKDSKFLLQNEELLIEGFLTGVKSKDLTYLWSDFVARPLDGTQADGRVVALQREGEGKSRRDSEALRTEFCIDWYWVYSSNGVVVYEVYSHTTCGSASCDSARTADAQDACLDNGIGGGGDGDLENAEIDMARLLNCHKNIVLNLIGETQGEFKKIFNKFAGNNPVPQNYNVRFQYGNCFPSTGAIACNNPSLNNGWATITINQTVNKYATDLSFAGTILHEILHSYLLFEESYPSDCDLNCLLNKYIVKYGSNNLNDPHHNLFVETKFLNDISFELKNYAAGVGYNVQLLGDQFFKDMAWGGLSKTEVFMKLSDVDRARITNTIGAEFYNENYNGTFPNGEKACD
jgi:hypothetical protein